MRGEAEEGEGEGGEGLDLDVVSVAGWFCFLMCNLGLVRFGYQHVLIRNSCES